MAVTVSASSLALPRCKAGSEVWLRPYEFIPDGLYLFSGDNGVVPNIGETVESVPRAFRAEFDHGPEGSARLRAI